VFELPLDCGASAILAHTPHATVLLCNVGAVGLPCYCTMHARVLLRRWRVDALPVQQILHTSPEHQPGKGKKELNLLSETATLLTATLELSAAPSQGHALLASCGTCSVTS